MTSKIEQSWKASLNSTQIASFYMNKSSLTIPKGIYILIVNKAQHNQNAIINIGYNPDNNSYDIRELVNTSSGSFTISTSGDNLVIYNPYKYSYCLLIKLAESTPIEYTIS